LQCLQNAEEAVFSVTLTTPIQPSGWLQVSDSGSTLRACALGGR